MPAKRKSAFSAALREAQQQHGETVSQHDSEAVTPLSSETVSQHDSETVKLLDSEAVSQQGGEAVGQKNSETVSQPVRKVGKPSKSQRRREAVSQQGGETVGLLDSSTVAQQGSEAVKPLNGETGKLSYRETAERPHSNTVTQSHGRTVKKERKISFYLTPEQESKLDDLAYEYLKRTGKRINRNDIVRHLVDQCSGIPDNVVFD